jgi:hypothetical protein
MARVSFALPRDRLRRRKERKAAGQGRSNERLELPGALPNLDAALAEVTDWRLRVASRSAHPSCY